MINYETASAVGLIGILVMSVILAFHALHFIAQEK